MEKRIIIIGIDGGTWRILRPLIEEGIMPNLGTIVKSGAAGILRSTIPPVTAPAWTSFMTGVSPARHGIFEFNNYNGKYKTYFVNNTSIKYKLLWEILSDFGKRVISVNVPMTYPPFPLNGVLVTGMLTPGTNVIFTFPPALSKEILEKIKGYRITTTGRVYFISGLNKFVEELNLTIKKRVELGKYLLNKENWDIAMVHFQSSDIFQHFAYHCISAEHPYFDKACREKAIEVYKTLDIALGELLSTAEKKGKLITILLSDHGFRPVYKKVLINTLLYKLGYLVLKDYSFPRKMISNCTGLIKKIDVLKLHQWFLGKRTRKKLKETVSLSNIDFSKTKAFVINGGVYGNIFINLKGREPNGIIEESAYASLRLEIKEKLEEEKDPETGKKYMKVITKEEAYGDTDYLGAPDLIVIPDDGYTISPSMFINKTPIKKARVRIDYTGNHEREGIIVITGPGVREGYWGEASLLDILPTILWYLDLPIPEYLEGKILREFFREDFYKNEPVNKKNTKFGMYRKFFLQSRCTAIKSKLENNNH